MSSKDKRILSKHNDTVIMGGWGIHFWGEEMIGVDTKPDTEHKFDNKPVNLEKES